MHILESHPSFPPCAEHLLEAAKSCVVLDGCELGLEDLLLCPHYHAELTPPGMTHV